MKLNFLNNYSGKLGAGDPYSGSTTQYLAELASIERRLVEIDQQLLSPALEQSTRNDMMNEKVRLMARKAAINAWLKMSTAQKNKVNASNYVNNLTQTYLKPLNKVKNQYQDNGLDLINTQIAGMPLWLALAVGSAAAYVLYKYIR